MQWSWPCVIFIFRFFFFFIGWTPFSLHCLHFRFLCIVSASWNDGCKRQSLALAYTWTSFCPEHLFPLALRCEGFSGLKHLSPLAALKWVSKFTPHSVLYCLSGCRTNKHKPCLCQNWPQLTSQSKENKPADLAAVVEGAEGFGLPGVLSASVRGGSSWSCSAEQSSFPSSHGQLWEAKWLRRFWCASAHLSQLGDKVELTDRAEINALCTVLSALRKWKS